MTEAKVRLAFRPYRLVILLAWIDGFSCSTMIMSLEGALHFIDVSSRGTEYYIDDCICSCICTQDCSHCCDTAFSPPCLPKDMIQLQEAVSSLIYATALRSIRSVALRVIRLISLFISRNHKALSHWDLIRIACLALHRPRGWLPGKHWRVISPSTLRLWWSKACTSRLCGCSTSTTF